MSRKLSSMATIIYSPLIAHISGTLGPISLSRKQGTNYARARPRRIWDPVESYLQHGWRRAYRIASKLSYETFRWPDGTWHPWSQEQPGKRDFLKANMRNIRKHKPTKPVKQNTRYKTIEDAIRIHHSPSTTIEWDLTPAPAIADNRMIIFTRRTDDGFYTYHSYDEIPPSARAFEIEDLPEGFEYEFHLLVHHIHLHTYERPIGLWEWV